MHLDGAYNWCNKAFGIIGIGMNSIGSHYNPVSINIVNSESIDAIEASWNASTYGLFTFLNRRNFAENLNAGSVPWLRSKSLVTKAGYLGSTLHPTMEKRITFR
jgi:hypothetical protein